MNKKITIITLILSIVLIIMYYLNSFSVIDNFIFSLLKPIRNDFLTYIFLFITEFGYIYGISLIMIFIFIKNKQLAILELYNIALVVPLNYILKSIFVRARPIENLVSVSGYSFPSGHTMTSVAFYGFLAYYIYKSNNKNKKLYIGLLILTVFLIGISRIYLRAHFATDVITGIVMALCYLLIFIRIIYNRKEEYKWEKQLLYLAF